MTTFRCPDCLMVSHHPMDVQLGYCGNCHDFTGPELRKPSSDAVGDPCERGQAAAACGHEKDSQGEDHPGVAQAADEAW
jgi:hypothetical protein